MALAKAEAAKLKEIFDDPIKWAQAFLRTFDPREKKIVPWTARWYQVEMLRDKHTRKVYRCGRRIGKCLPGHTRVYDPRTGDRVPVEELYKQGKAHLVTMTDDYKLSAHFTNEILDNGIKEVFRVTTKTGRHIDATGNHPLFTAKGWMAIDFLKPGDKVALAGNMGFFGNHYINENEIKLLAYMIGDGNCSSKTIRFCTASEAIRKEMERAVNYFDCEMVQYASNRDIDFNIVKKQNRNNRTYPNKIKEILEHHGVYGKTAHTKTIPSEIFNLDRNDTALFLSRLYATDGWAHTKNNKQQIGYCSVSRELIADIQHLLLKFGINSYVNVKKAKYNGDIKISYQLLITNSNDVIKFYKEIGIFSKEEACKAAFESAIKNNKYDTYLPKEILEFVEEDRVRQGLSKADLCKSNKHARLRMNYDIQRSRLREFAEILDNEDLKNFADGDFIFDEIVSIESLGEMQTYDLSVPLTMNFIAEDFITHNTETMVVEMLYLAFTKKNFRVLMAAPYENQIRNMFTRLNELISESPLVKQAVVSSTKNPAKIEFANGSMILGFTTGDDAASVRGQRADWIFIDEIDFMSEYCFEVVAAVAIERAEIGITVSSTPLGKRSHFYRMCTDPSMNYSQHFHPSTHNPNWNDQMEAELRAQLTAEGYVHEVLAEFGTQETGVFDKDKLDAAQKVLNYAYNPLDYFQQKKCIEEGNEPEILMYNQSFKAPRNIFRTMGVDWDKYGANSSILILDYDTRLGKFKVFKRVEVPRSEYSYDAAINTIVELNEIYNPSWIYCDAGSGEYQIERLHIIGEENPHTGLKSKVKRWSFANKLDIMDPITKEFEKKPLKPFMVNQLQIAFERDKMILSPYDTTLAKQLTDYEVVKMTESGVPKYTSENEHFVDALGLAYLAMVLEFKDLTGMIQEPEVTSEFVISHKQIGGMAAKIESETRASSDNRIVDFYNNTDFEDLPGDRQRWVKVDESYKSPRYGRGSSWGSRSSGGFGRTSFGRGFGR